MRYILDDSGYIYSVSCNPIECDSKGCTGYTGAVPEGYDSLEIWATTANIRAYKIVDGNLVYDANRAAALEAEWNQCESLLDALFYKSGDTFNISTLMVSGVLTSGKLDVMFSIYTDKSIANVEIESVTLPRLQIRHADGGYIASNVSATSLGAVKFQKGTDKSITVTLTLKTASSFANNSTVAVFILDGAVKFK